jgi:hypothetical protein
MIVVGSIGFMGLVAAGFLRNPEPAQVSSAVS